MRTDIPPEPKVLIQGAGIAGLTLAGLLERRGIEYRLVEQAPALEPVGAGIVIQPNARAVLEGLDLGDALAVAGCGLRSMSVGPAGYDRPVVFPTTRFAIGVHRGDLHRMLLSRVPSHRLQLGCTLSRWEIRSDQIQVCLSTGEEWTATHLIGADGLNSAIRQQLGIVDDRRASGQWCWRTLLPTQPLGPHGLEWVRGAARLGAIPIGHQRTYVYWVQTGSDRDMDQPPPNAHTFADWALEGAALAAALPARPDWLCHPLSDRPVRWGKGPVILIGDAAHPVTPNLGQGAALGMEDAWVLADLLVKGRGAAGSLQHRRHRRVDGVRQLSWWAGQFAHWQGGLGSVLRDPLYRLVPNRAVLKSQQRFVDQFIP